ncbi:hypothetical protein Tco_1385688 [Tanacetum coccineum]
MHADLKYVESHEKEIEKLESNKAKFSNMYDLLLQECVSNDVMYSYLHSLSGLDAHTEFQCLYLNKVKECECLSQKLSKETEIVHKEVYNELSRSFTKLEKHSISLELTLQQCQEQMKNDTVCNEKASNVYLKEREQYFEIQDLKAQLQDKNIAIIAVQTVTAVLTFWIAKLSFLDVTACASFVRETRAIFFFTCAFLSTTWHFSLGLDQSEMGSDITYCQVINNLSKIAKLALVVVIKGNGLVFGLMVMGLDPGLAFLASALYSSDSRVRACPFLTVFL